MTEHGPDAAQLSDQSIRIYLVDDHAVVRRGMQAFLGMVEGMEVVGEASNGEAALEGIEALIQGGQSPEVVMMDLLMPGMDGIAATTLIKDCLLYTSPSPRDRG